MSPAAMFLKALAAQMLVDFWPVPWKGRVGILKDRPYLGGALVAAITLVLSLGQLSSRTVLGCIVLSFLYGATRAILASRGVAIRTPADPHGPQGAAANARAAMVILAVSLVISSTLFLVSFKERLGAPAAPSNWPRLSWRLLTTSPLHSWIIGYAFSLGAGSLLVGALLAGMQQKLSKREPETEAGDAQGEPVAENDAGLEYAGRLIGFFEAFVITTLVAVNQWTAISFLVAAKAIGRFKQMERRQFAEYFLVGTLANVSIAIVGGIIIRFTSALWWMQVL